METEEFINLITMLDPRKCDSPWRSRVSNSCGRAAQLESLPTMMPTSSRAMRSRFRSADWMARLVARAQ